MKKLFIFASLSLIFLSGCFLFQKKEEVPQPSQQEAQMEKKVGMVNTAFDLNIDQPLTPFVLLAETQEKIFLDSVSINLKKYSKRRVEAQGKWNDLKTVFVVESVTSLGQETQIKQTYQSLEMGIKFPYPSIWVVKEEKNVGKLKEIVITPYEVDETDALKIDTIVIEISENNRKLPVRQWLNLNDKYISKDPADAGNSYLESFIGVAQLPAVKKTYGTGEKVEFYTGRDTFIYKFQHVTAGDSDKDIYRNAFYDIISGFEFLPFGKTAKTEEKAEKPAVLSAAPKSNLEALAKEELQKRAEEELKKQQAQQLLQELELAQKQKKDSATQKKLFVDYVKANINSLAPEPAAGAWKVLSVEFAAEVGKPDEFTSLYVTYSDGGDIRKILLSIPNRADPSKMQQTAYFKPGDKQTWDTAEGSDTAKSLEKTLQNVSAGEQKEVVIKPGMQLIPATSFKVKIQVPASWYWSFVNGGYSFSTKPVTAENTLMSFTKETSLAAVKAKLGTMSFVDTEIAGKKGIMSSGGGTGIMCIEGEKGKYCLTGDKTYTDVMGKIFETLQE